MAAQLDPDIRLVSNGLCEIDYISVGLLEDIMLTYGLYLRRTKNGEKCVDRLYVPHPTGYGLMTLCYETALEDMTWHNDFHPDLFQFGSKAENKKRHLGAMQKMWEKLTGLPLPAGKVGTNGAVEGVADDGPVDDTIAEDELSDAMVSTFSRLPEGRLEHEELPAPRSLATLSSRATDEPSRAQPAEEMRSRTPSTLAGDDCQTVVADARVSPPITPQARPPKTTRTGRNVVAKPTASNAAIKATPETRAAGTTQTPAIFGRPPQQPVLPATPVSLFPVRTVRPLKHTRDAEAEDEDRRVRRRVSAPEYSMPDMRVGRFLSDGVRREALAMPGAVHGVVAAQEVYEGRVEEVANVADIVVASDDTRSLPQKALLRSPIRQ